MTDELASRRAHEAARDAVALITAMANRDESLAVELAEKINRPFATAFVAASLAAGFVIEKSESADVPLTEVLEHLAYRIETMEIP